MNRWPLVWGSSMYEPIPIREMVCRIIEAEMERQARLMDHEFRRRSTMEQAAHQRAVFESWRP